MSLPKLKREHKKALSDSALIICFTTMPTILSIALIQFGIINKEFSTLYDDGEFFLYSISFLGSAYIIYKQLNNELFKSYGNTIVALLFFVSSLYSASSLSSDNKKLPIILIVSILFLIISIPLLYKSQVMSNKQSDIDVRNIRNNEQLKIEDSLS